MWYRSKQSGLVAPARKAGFSILEMVVVTAIFMMVTGVVLANLPKFRNRASLDLTAQEVALSIREAQVFGTATRVASVDQNSYPWYGIHFELGEGPAKKFVLFADEGLPDDLSATKNYTYEAGDGCSENNQNTECLEEYLIDGDFSILKICINDVEECYDNDVALDLVYRRPFPEPSICLITDIASGNNVTDCEQITNAAITIGTINGDTRDVVVWNNGQITARSNNNPTP